MFNFFTFVRMNKIYSYYKENLEAYARRTNHLRKQIHLLGTVRLLLVAAALLSVWFLRNQSWEIIVAVLAVYIIPFAALMIWHSLLSKKKIYTEALINLNQNELKGLDYDYSSFDGADEKNSPGHSFSLDLDLFGKKSIFQSVNRTVTVFGKDLLSKWFLEPLTNKEGILQRQEAIRELSEYTQLRQHFIVTGSGKSSSINDRSRLESFAQEKTLFLKSTLWNILLWLIPVIWFLLALAVALGYVNSSILGIWFAFSFIIAYLPTQKITKLYDTVNKMEKIFAVYSDLMKSIENTPFQSAALSDISQQLTRNGVTASHAIKQLSGFIGGLDQRFSAAGIILNILYLRDMRHAIQLEKWKVRYKDDMTTWLDALAHFDAYNSLAGFAFNHPDYIYPEIADTYFTIQGKALGHPLLHRDVCVKNDINILKSPSFLVITGANMAGKSTYLRTVGVNYLLACIGAPVFAESLIVYPANLVTSLRTTDSLVSNESYFFAELKRLKMIIDRLQSGEELFIILDEILKGTNSVDKQKGSLALMKQLVNYKTCGIIATHDLVLGTLEEEFPEEIKNYRFEADIINDELSFSYLLREGIAQNMNAYFLMKKMGITV